MRALLFAALVGAALAATGLQIHVFDVGQAASELIVFPSGYSILVDCGETNYASHSNADSVAKKVEAILGSKSVDVAVSSHMHMDHIGYVGKGGFWYLLEQAGFTFGKFLDRDHGIWTDANGDGKCEDTEIAWHNMGSVANTQTLWVCYATDPSTKLYKVREVAKMCSKTQIDPPDDAASVTITTVDAAGVKQKTGKALPGDHTAETNPPNENDWSIGLLIKYGNFTYHTAGDLDGVYYTAQGYEYNDEESVVQKRVGQVDVLHVNHHGSSHSSNQKWVDALNPAVSVITLGSTNTYGHPDQEVLDRLVAQSDVYLTEKGDPARDYSKVMIAGDISITVPKGGKKFTVSGGKYENSYATKGAVAPKCAV